MRGNLTSSRPRGCAASSICPVVVGTDRKQSHTRNLLIGDCGDEYR